MSSSQLTIQYWTGLHLSKYIRVRGEAELENNNVYTNMMFRTRKTKVLSNFRVFCIFPTVKSPALGTRGRDFIQVCKSLCVFEIYKLNKSVPMLDKVKFS